MTARTFIGWFGAQRRTYWNVRLIRAGLERHGLETASDFEGVYIDSELSFLQVPTERKQQDQAEAVPEVYADPSYRIGKLAAANNPPLSVKLDDSVATAVTEMIANDYSQLPVMTSSREVKGVLTWESLGSRLALGSQSKYVRDCMAAHKEISADTYIFSAINDIVTNQYVLIRNSENEICGIVTTTDLSLQLRQLGEPFLLLREIENYLRRMMTDKFTIEQLTAARDQSDSERDISSISDLTLGECRHLIEDPSNWTELEVQIDRAVFVKKLDDVCRIRNEVMHFDPDGITDQDLDQLRNFVRLLQKLAKVGAI